MQKQRTIILLLFIAGILFLMPGFYRNTWKVVEPERYENWQFTVDRTVIARLSKTRQDGFFSAGGLLGLGDAKKWNFDERTNKHQIAVYLEGRQFNSYFPYRSNPGFQGLVFGLIDSATNLPNAKNLKIFRGIVALGSAIILTLISLGLGLEFGWLSGILVLVFVGFVEWLILPAGSIYWNLWSIYLPFISSASTLAFKSKGNADREKMIFGALYIANVAKILFSGFEVITSVLIMSTVPFLYFAILEKWERRVLLSRSLKLGTVLTAAVLTGLIILILQIWLVDETFSKSIQYILKTLDRRAIGDPADYTDYYAESMRASTVSVVLKYLSIAAIKLHLNGWNFSITYLQLILIFLFFTLVFLLCRRNTPDHQTTLKGKALVAAMWYSILAPLSWFIVFKPTSYIHTAIFPMVWQMPFVLLGIALCGFVILDLFNEQM